MLKTDREIKCQKECAKVYLSYGWLLYEGMSFDRRTNVALVDGSTVAIITNDHGREEGRGKIMKEPRLVVVCTTSQTFAPINTAPSQAVLSDSDSKYDKWNGPSSLPTPHANNFKLFTFSCTSDFCCSRDAVVCS